MNVIMKSKQVLIDIGVVLVIPALVLAGLYFLNSKSDNALLSLVAPPTEEHIGAKAKIALETLKSISMDDSLFKDTCDPGVDGDPCRVYQSLQEFHVDVPPATLGRTYPFVPPDALFKLKVAQ